MPTHHLKIQRQPFADLVSGRKTGEVRNCADREFQEGDQVELFLIDETGNLANKSIVRTITHIQRGYGLPDDICVLSYSTHVIGGRPIEGVRERFQKWVLATKHPVFGFLDGRSLARGDDREGYADEYVQGLWVAYKEFTSQPAAVSVALDERAEFVAWVRREWPQAPLSNVRDLLPKSDPRYGEYCDESLQRAWVGWQARAAMPGK